MLIKSKKIFLKIRLNIVLAIFFVFFVSANAIINPIKAVASSSNYLADKLSTQEYPKIANYFLSWSLRDKDVYNLAKWDVLILDMENQINNPEKIKKIKKLNPNIVILAYVPIEEIAYNDANYKYTKLRKKLFDYSPEAWYLHDGQGKRLGFWLDSKIMNITDDAPLKNGERWNSFLPYFVKTKILASGLWDGIFYDNTSDAISWVRSGNIDLNNDRRVESNSYIDRQWKKGTMKILKLSRELSPDLLIIGNSASDIDFQKYLNGRMFETFPTPWEGDWAYVSNLYLNKFPTKSLWPNLYVINSNTENVGLMDNYRKMRYGLTSTLLGSGYYSFDFGDQAHAQTWWYDEYDSFLGKPQSKAYNLLDHNSQKLKDGLWRRDFDKAVVIVNASDQEQDYVFKGESFEKINGQQDRRINNGTKINWLRLAPRDGVILLKTNNDLIGVNYFNGNFVRVFDNNGFQKQNGFFAFEDGYQGNTEILKTDLDGDGHLEILVNGNGKISIYKNDQNIKTFYPYTKNFKQHISFAVGDLDGDGQQEIVTGAGPGGGPHVRIFNKNGQLIDPGFFAYNKNFLGGISVAVGDLDGDGQQEIVTGAGPGGGPHVRVFNRHGGLINQFFAYADNFYGGISVAIGNVQGDSLQEIVIAPGLTGKSQIKIFTQYGKLLKQFRSYNYQKQVNTRVATNDIDHDGVDEILASISDF